MSHSYIEAIGEGWPGCQCTAPGDGSVYETIIWESGVALPSKEELDAWIREAEKKEKWREIQAERDRRKSGGVKVGEKWFHSDDTSRIQQLGLVMMGANMPAGIMWKTMDNSFVQMTPTLALQIFMSVATSDQTIFGTAEYHKAQMLAAADPAAYNFLVGWPKVYGEL